MSIVFTFEMSTSASSLYLASHTATECEFRRASHAIPDQIALERPGVWAVFRDENEDMFDLRRTSYGFQPNRVVFFEIEKFEMYTDGMVSMLSAVSTILRAFEGDAVFLENMDTPRLLRRHGALFLDNQDDWWVSENEKFFGDLPHRTQSLPFLGEAPKT